MFTGPEIEATLSELGVSHVIWVPDSTLGLWERDLHASSRVRLVRVCREGEAWPLAGGLLLGGAKPVVMMQTTGLYESGDALRNVVYDLQLPVFALIGVRNWLLPDSRDSARRFVLPITEAWNLPCRWIETEQDKPRLAEHYRECQRLRQAGLILMAEGKG